MNEIEQIGRDHAYKLAKLQADTFRQAYSDVHSLDDIEVYCLANYTPELAEHELADKETICCFGLLNSVLSGYYILKHRDPPIPVGFSAVGLKQIYVLSSAYGSGLAQALYEHALDYAQTLESEGLWLCVSDINHRAKAFYDRLEFKSVGEGPILKVGSDHLPSSILVFKFSC